LNLIRIMPAKGWERLQQLFRIRACCAGVACLAEVTMDSSIFLARLLGPAMLVVVAGLLVNRSHHRALVEGFIDSPALIYLAGLLALVGGLAIVLTHNVWVWGWPVVITLFGWATLIAGILRIVFPAPLKRFAERIVDNQAMFAGAAVIYLVLGAWLTYAGYFA